MVAGGLVDRVTKKKYLVPFWRYPAGVAGNRVTSQGEILGFLRRSGLETFELAAVWHTSGTQKEHKRSAKRSQVLGRGHSVSPHSEGRLPIREFNWTVSCKPPAYISTCCLHVFLDSLSFTQSGSVRWMDAHPKTAHTDTMRAGWLHLTCRSERHIVKVYNHWGLWLKIRSVPRVSWTRRITTWETAGDPPSTARFLPFQRQAGHSIDRKTRYGTIKTSWMLPREPCSLV